MFFSGIGTLIYLGFVRNRVPSYLGSSAAFIAPVLAAQQVGGIPAALGGVAVTGAAFFAIGLLVDRKGSGAIQRLMPPLVTGTIVAVIGFNLAPIAKTQWDQGKLAAFVTLVAILVIGVAFRGFIGRIAIFLGVIVGYAFAAARGDVDFGPVREAAWVGLPALTAPSFQAAAIVLVLPAVLVLIAENAGHVKAVSEMTGADLDKDLGKAFMGDGAATTVAGAFGGAGTTTYAENIGVMAATRVYSTAAYIVAAFAAILFGLCPKFGVLVGSIPAGVLGGVTIVLYGMIAVLGAKIWVERPGRLRQDQQPRCRRPSDHPRRRRLRWSPTGSASAASRWAPWSRSSPTTACAPWAGGATTCSASGGGLPPRGRVPHSAGVTG